MMEVLSAREMQRADRHTIEVLGVPSLRLMENAGSAVARIIRERWGTPSLAIVCGKGNNGGDGFVVARHLLDLKPRVFLAARRHELRSDAATNASRLAGEGGVIQEVETIEDWERESVHARHAEVVVDALLGTGLRGPAEGVIGAIIGGLGRPRSAGQRVVSVDIPSGIGDDGVAFGAAVRADVTVTFARPKTAHVFSPGSHHTGELVIVDIGIPDEAIRFEGPALYRIDPSDALAAWPARPRDAHKGTFGHLLIIGGSPGKTGAAILCGTGALRSGAGLVTVATAAACVTTVASSVPELMTASLGADALATALGLAADRDAVVAGPGCGRTEAGREFLFSFLAAVKVPAVVDADALFALGALPGGSARPRPWVLTPHPGEAARLLATRIELVQSSRREAVREIARRSGAVTVLKGEGTLVADPTGRVAVNPTGSPAMAKGGSGDVLAGVIGALLARGCDPWSAATAGAFVHGLAGEEAAAATGEEGLLASEIASQIGRSLRGLRGGH